VPSVNTCQDILVSKQFLPILKDLKTLLSETSNSCSNEK
jgi:hypothetical protein